MKAQRLCWKALLRSLTTVRLMMPFVVLAVGAAYSQERPKAQIPETAIGNKTACGAVNPPRCQKEVKFKNSLPEPLRDRGNAAVGSEHPILLGRKPVEALPLNATAIIIGIVESATAHVTEDATGVYSEFGIRVSELVKQDTQKPVATGDLIIADRFGGAVRFPSGRVERFMYRGEGFPIPGATYVLFLSRSATSTDYYIYTGYRIDAGRISPLDGGTQFTNYSTMSASDFVVFLKSALEGERHEEK